MEIMKKKSMRALAALFAVLILALSGIGGRFSAGGEARAASAKAGVSSLDMSAWLYSEEDDVYYQTGLSYCASPADADYETMGIFV
ncbi:MAG: hypothetical protein J5967_01045, partial [Oscillospiraceae bacterium]|nr:hypothetical protein [Oscillospiraceae bacterium]